MMGEPDPTCIACDGDGTEVCGRCPNRWEHALGATCDNAKCEGGMEPCRCVSKTETADDEETT